MTLPETPKGSLERLALEFHKQVEGEYGCPGLTCPGVQRLIFALTALKGYGQREDVRTTMDTAEPVVAFHREMALRFAEDRDEKKHALRATEATLAALRASEGPRETPEAFLKARAPGGCHRDVRAYTYSEVLTLLADYVAEGPQGTASASPQAVPPPPATQEPTR